VAAEKEEYCRTGRAYIVRTSCCRDLREMEQLIIVKCILRNVFSVIILHDYDIIYMDLPTDAFRYR
jgi:hypothetical protein